MHYHDVAKSFSHREASRRLTRDSDHVQRKKDIYIYMYCTYKKPTIKHL